MILNRRNLLLSATVGAAGAVMTNIVSAKERNLDPDMDAIIARMMNVTKCAEQHCLLNKNILFY